MKTCTETIYICNTCEEEYSYKNEAANCHPNVVEKEVDCIEYKTRSGKVKREVVRAE